MNKQHRNLTDLNEETLITLYEDYSDPIYRYAFRHLSREDLAEECVSDVFTRFLERIDIGSPLTGNISAYLYRIAHNWIVDFYRKRKPDENLDTEPVSLEKNNPENRLVGKQEHEILRKAMIQLPEDQRNVIELRVMEQWSHEKVAEFLDKSVQASRALQYRAIKNLRQALDSQRM